MIKQAKADPTPSQQQETRTQDQYSRNTVADNSSTISFLYDELKRKDEQIAKLKEEKQFLVDILIRKHGELLEQNNDRKRTQDTQDGR